MLMLVGADVPGGVLKPPQERETQFLDNLSNDKMHAHIHCRLYLSIYIYTHNVQIVFISTHTIDRADEAAFYGSTSDTDKSYLGCGGGVIHGNIWYKYSL